MATIASQVALRHFSEVTEVREKQDGTSVTEADLAVEQALLDHLHHHRPEDGIVSEEAGEETGGGGRRWILDPIDGTNGFVARNQHWGTHIALEVDDQVVMGLLTRPVLGARWWAASGMGAYRSSDRNPTEKPVLLALSEQSTLKGARVGLLTRQSETQIPGRLAEHGVTVVVATPAQSVVVDLLEGRLDAVVSENARTPWDDAPAQILTVEAGGTFADREGGMNRAVAPLIYGNGFLDHPLREALAPDVPSPNTDVVG